MSRVSAICSLMLTGVFLWSTFAVCAAAEPELTSKVSSLALGLQSPDFTSRRECQQELANVGEQNPEVLEQLVLESSPEVAVRLVRLLEGIFLKRADGTGDRAEHALERIRRSSHPIAVEADTILREHWRVRESRARVAVEKLGGSFAYKAISDPELRAQRWTFGDEVYDSHVPAVLHSVFLHDDWKGTSADLWHLARLSHARSLSIYLIRGNDVNIDDLLKLSGTLNDVQIESRGACLGILNLPTTTECIVSRVVSGSPAELAGLRAEDVILSLDGEPLTTFRQLVQRLQNYEIGDVITLNVRRRGQDLVVPVTLDSWRKSLLSNEDFVSPPPLYLGPFSDVAEIAPTPPATSQLQAR